MFVSLVVLPVIALVGLVGVRFTLELSTPARLVEATQVF